jgi:hypothetical protein
MTEANESQTYREECRVHGAQLKEKVKGLLHEGNVRHIHILHGNNTVMELPLTVVTIGVLIAPVAAALGLLTALITECTLVVERQA